MNDSVGEADLLTRYPLIKLPPLKPLRLPVALESSSEGLSVSTVMVVGAEAA